jgi:hypothetical protein
VTCDCRSPILTGRARREPAVSDAARTQRGPDYLSVWSSISAVGALRLTDSMPLIALALLS